MKYKVTKYKTITDKLKSSIETEIKMMLHAHRDCLRNRKRDTSIIRFDINDGYYGEAFGIMRALKVLGFGYFGDSITYDGNSNHDDHHNLKDWMLKLEDQALTEENYGGNDQCDHCVAKYGKDGAGRGR